MKQHKALSESRIEFYSKQLIPPSVDYPHYSPLIIDEVNIQEYMDIAPLGGEIFHKYGLSDKLYVSNYGRILYNNEIVKQYVCGTFLDCTFFYINGIGDYEVDRLVKKTFDPIENMDELEVHHINNNGLDNRPQNLLWVTQGERNRIKRNFNMTLQAFTTYIRIKTKIKLTTLFRSNPDEVFTGFEICLLNQNMSSGIISDVLDNMEKAGIIENISEEEMIMRQNTSFYDKRYILKRPDAA